MKDFWNNRAKKYGHTGWTDNFIYIYDQQARLLAIEKILNSFTGNKSIALDFGTGSGDFANLLAKYFKEVIAFDISDAAIEIAKGKFGKAENIQFLSGNHIEEIQIPAGKVNLILTVTVLDHITDDSELIKTLKYFQKIISEDGIIIVLEYALDMKKQSNYYQRFMTLEEWRTIFLNHGFHLHKYYGFYHPIESQCDSYLSYKRCTSGIKGTVLKLFTKYLSSTLVNGYLNRLATKYLQGRDDFFWEGRKPSPIKIMVYFKNKYV